MVAVFTWRFLRRRVHFTEVLNLQLYYVASRNTAIMFDVKIAAIQMLSFNPWLAVPWLRSLVVGLSPRRPGFTPGSIHVGFVVDKVALGQVFLRVLRFSPVNIIPPSLSKLVI
jgi:hypothetical protein